MEPNATSRRLHVATSPRRDVSTSRRHHVATSARGSTPHHLKHGELGNEGIGKRTNRGIDFQSQRIQISRVCLGFVPLSILLDIIEDIMMMFLVLYILFFSFMMF